MRKEMTIKIALALFILIFSLQLSTAAYIGLEKDTYYVGEIIEISLDLPLLDENFDSYGMKIVSDNNVMKYSGELKDIIIFSPKKEGEYKVLIDTSSGIIEEMSFSVAKQPETQAPQTIEPDLKEEIPENEGYPKEDKILEKQEYDLGEDVEINIDDNESIKVEVKGNRDFMSYVGSISKKLFFRPTESGEYQIIFKDVYNNIIRSLSFKVNDSEDSSNPLSVSQSPDEGSHNSEEVRKAIEDIDSKYSQSTEEKTLKIRNSKDQLRFLDARVTGDSDIVISNSSGKLKKAIFHNVKSNDFDLGYEEHDQKRSKQISKEISKGVLNSYAIDPTAISFDNASLIMNAKGTELYKCAEWVFALQACHGDWVKVKDIIPGQDYELIIGPVDPGYAETGVASINTNKSIYHPGESVKVLMAFLDNSGFLVDPDNASIVVMDPYGNPYGANLPDMKRISKGIYEYVFGYATSEGTYQIDAEAQGNNIDVLMITSFEVKSFYGFDIIRDAPITIDPWQGPFTSSVSIKPYMQTDGSTINFTEVIPKDYEVVDSGGSVVVDLPSSKMMKWDNIPSDSQLSYKVQAPLKTPDLHQLGPSVIRYVIDTSSQMFIEARPWYIAIDPVSDIATSTCNLMIDENADNSFVDGACSATTNIDADDTTYETVSIGSSSKWQGIEATAGSLSNCYQVNSVNACYSWWTGASNLASCQVDVSNDGAGGASYANIDRTCRAADPGLICVDVTATLTWVCSSFDSNNAAIKIHFNGRRTQVNYDAAFFRVNYTQYSNPPTVVSYAKNESPVYQNVSVKFNSTWSDDQSLSYYIFSINQGSGWTNSSAVAFGAGTLAQNITKITASVGTTVYWRFYANDSQNQWTAMTTQSFVVAPASDTIFPSVNSLTVTPSNGVSGTTFNITANITDNVGVSSAKAEVTFPDGSKANYTLVQQGGGDFWQYLYASNIGGNFSVKAYASDSNGNTNTSILKYFNVTSTVTVDKTYYSRGETVSIIGGGLSKNDDVTLTIKRKSDGSVVATFPMNISSNSTGGVSYGWSIPTDLAFLPGNYTISLNDTYKSNLDAGTELIVIFRPDSALLTDRVSSGADVLVNVNETDDLDQSIYVTRASGSKEDYIELDFLDNIPSGQQIDSVTFGFEHYENQAGGPWDVYIRWYNTSSSSWVNACTYSPSSTNRISLCNLTSYIKSSTQANSAKIRISDNNLAVHNGAWLTYVNFTFLDIQYQTGSTTTVLINEPTYDVSTYTYADTTNNKAYHGSKDGTYTTLLTGTEASSTNYTRLQTSNDQKYNHTISGAANGQRAYQSFVFKVTESTSLISQIDFKYEGHSRKTTSLVSDQYFIYAWNINTASYDLLYTSAASSVDTSATASVTAISDYVNSSTGNIYFLVETTGVQNQAGGENTRSLRTDLAELDVKQYPTISGTQYINVTAIDSDGIGSCNYSFRSTSVNGNLSTAGGNYWNGSVNTLLLTDGFYWLDATCVDSLISSPGNDSIYVRVSNQAPSVVLIYPGNNANFSVKTFDVQFNTTDISGGLISCNVTLNGKVNNTLPIIATSGAITNYTLSGLADNTYNWNVTCWKTQSVTNTSSTWKFTVDTTPPTITKGYPVPGQYLNLTSFSFLFTPYDLHGLMNCSLYIDGSFNQSKNKTQLTNGAQNTFAVSGLTQGLHTWDVKCYDSFSNNRTTTTTNFTVDLVKPSISLYAPSPGQLFGYNNIQFNWSVLDALDPTLTCNLTLDGSVRPEATGVSAYNNTNVSRQITVVNGLHYWNVTCWDSAGNRNTSLTQNFTIAAPPLPILISPANYTGGFTTTTGTFIYNATHTNGIDNCSLYIDGSFVQNDSTIALNKYNNFTVPGLLSGNHTWQVKCENPSGIGNSSIRIFWVDLMDPNVTLDSPKNGAEINSSNVTLAWFATDDLTQNLTCTLRVKGTTYSGLIAQNDTNRTYNLTGLTDGNYTWNVTCYDRLGRSDMSETWWFKVNGAPTITLVYPVNRANISSSSITFLFIPTDSGGLGNCSIYMDGSFKDSKNSTELLNGLQNNFTISSISQGKHNWTIGCYDSVGDSNIVDAWNFTVDTTSPVVTPIVPNGTTYYSGDIYFNWTSTDNIFTQTSCTIDISGHGVVGPYTVSNTSMKSQLVTGIADGLHYYNITCQDTAGNNGTSQTLNFTVDTAPVITLVSPKDYIGINDTQATFTYLATDTSGVANCSLYLNGAYQGTNTSINLTGDNYFTKTGLSQGLYNWTVECYDTNGFATNSSTEYFYIDTTPLLNLTLNYPGNMSMVHLSTIGFNITAIDSITQIMSCDIAIDGSYNNTFDAANNTPTINSIGGFSEGQHSWQVSCFDSSSFYISSPTYYFNVSFDPWVSLVNPQPYSWHNSSDVTLYYTPYDNNNTLMYCDLYVNGSLNKGLGSPASGVMQSTTLNGLGQSSYTWFIRCGDWDLNVADSTTWNFTVDLTKPKINLTYPGPADFFNTSTVLFNFTAWDNMAPNMTCWIDLDGSTIDTALVYNDTYHNYTQTGIDDGIHFWNVTCTDLAGNSNTSLTRNFTVQEPPTVSLGNPKTNTRTRNTTITFFFTPYDNSNNISNCTLILNGQRNETGTPINASQPNNITASGFVDGEYNWTVNCTDAAGNEGTNATIKRLVVDLTPPSINLTYPAPEQVIGSETVNFNWSALDRWGMNLSCNLSIDGSVNATGIDLTSGSWVNHSVTLLYGPHNWSVTCWDDLNNWNVSETRNFTVQAPDLYVNNNRIWFNSSNPDLGDNISIRINISNIGSSTATNFKVQFWDGYPGVGTQIGSNKTVTIGPYANKTVNQSWVITAGYHNLWVLVNPDQFVFELDFTNNNATKNISVLSSAITYPGNNTWTKDLTPQINFTLGDYSGGTINYTILVDGSPNGQSGSVSDNASTLLNISALSQAQHYIIVRATDILGRIKNSARIYINVDNTSANANFITKNNTWFNVTTPNVYFNLSDNLDTNINYTFYLNGTFLYSSNATVGTQLNKSLGPLGEGRYNITIETLDEAMNVKNYTISIYVDTTKPWINLTSPINDANYTVTSVLLNISGYDGLASILNCTITLDGTPVKNANISEGGYLSYLATGLSEDVHYWNATCIDQAGNANTSETRSFNVFIPPRISLSSPAPGYWTKNASQIFYFNASDDTGIENCSLLINGSVNATKSGIANGEISNITGVLSEGVWNWAIRCYDNTTQNVMNVSANRTIKVDLTPPTPVITTKNQSWFNVANILIYFNLTDNLASNISYKLYQNGAVDSNGSFSNPSYGVSSSASIGGFANTIIIEAMDNAGNKANSTPITVYYDFRLPTIILNSPNATISTNSTVTFNFTVSDDRSTTLDCNLTIDGNVNKTYDDLPRPSTVIETIAGFTAGTHYWNVTCVDLAGNLRTSSTYNFTIPQPDLEITSGNITFSDNSPREGVNITIYANVYNINASAAANVIVRFYLGDPSFGGVQIGTDKNIAYIGAYSNYTVSVNWTTVMGTSDVYVLVDPADAIIETDETNNKAFNTIVISGYHIVSGNVSSTLNIDKGLYDTLFSWNKTDRTGDNIFVTDYESAVAWTSLQAIGRNASGSNQFNDFADIDSALSMTSFSDSINSTYTSGGSPRQTKTYDIFTNSIAFVPIVNSTNSSNFQTGILWDSADGNEYNGTQDLVFVTEVNMAKPGYGGVYDFELRIPAALREYKTTGNDKTVAFYAEVK